MRPLDMGSELELRIASMIHRARHSPPRMGSSLLAGLLMFGLLLAVTLGLRATAPVPTQLQAPSQPALSPKAPSLPPASSTERPGASKAASDRAAHAYAKLPLSFVPNAGQADRQIRYYAQGAGFSFSFMHDKAVLAFEKG